jgi:hypothetical protein
MVQETIKVRKARKRFNPKTAFEQRGLRGGVALSALEGFAEARLLARRTKPPSADAATAFASRVESRTVSGVIGINIVIGKIENVTRGWNKN